jgi:hypothetical protein
LKHPFKKFVGLSHAPNYSDSAADSLQDQLANHHGRNGARGSPSQSCSSVCAVFRPAGLSRRY